MSIIDRFKLEKLTINVYGNRLRIGVPKSRFKVMYNPESFSMSHSNAFQRLRGIHLHGQRARYMSSHSERLQLDFIFDGTGVADSGAAALLSQVPGLGGLATPSVSDQVESFLENCFYVDEELHEPRFLKIQWGQGELKAFDCRLESVEVAYTSFDRSGAPLRAKLAATFIEDTEPSKVLRVQNLHSPDVSRSRTVKAGDTLPALCKEIYGDASYYLFVARANQLDDFRNLRTGQSLLFPPLA
jgi:hypothetical protein